jgi:hypothetical protein
MRNYLSSRRFSAGEGNSQGTKMKIPTFTLLLLLLMVSCGPNPDKCRTDKALLEDNFNDTACGWDEYEEEQATAGYLGSEYFVAVHKPNTSAVATPGALFSNVSIQVEVRLDQGTVDNNFGVLCRYQDMDNFYAFLISSDGYYAIAKVIGGEPYSILSGDGTHLMPNEVILVEKDASNEIHAMCTGTELTLFVNGKQLAAVSDSDLESGDIGFIVSTYDQAPAHVHFDNLFVQEPAMPHPEAE